MCSVFGNFTKNGNRISEDEARFIVGQVMMTMVMMTMVMMMMPMTVVVDVVAVLTV